MPKIYIHGRVVEDFILQSGPARVLKVCIDTPSDVTVNFSSERGLFTVTSSLTFTTLNYNVFQNLTITPVNAGSWAPGAADFIIATASGFTPVRKKIYVLYTDQGKFLRNWSWYNNIHISSASDISTLTDYVKNFTHNNNYPTGHTPDSETASYSGSMHNTSTAAISGFSSVRKLDWNHLDVNGELWTHSTFYILASSPKSPREIVFIHGSHSDPNIVSMINKPLSRGFDVMYTAMPVTDATHIASAHSSLVTGTGSTGHKQLLSAGIDRDGYNAIEIFMFDKVKALNYVVNTGLYGDRIYQYGYSGGGVAIQLLAVDTRMTKSYMNRAIVPREWIIAPNPVTTHSDYETTGDGSGNYNFCGIRRYNFGTAVSLWDLLIIGNYGGRVFTVTTNYADSEGTGATWQDITFEKMQAVCSQFGGSFERLMFTNASNSAHDFYDEEIESILDAIES